MLAGDAISVLGHGLVVDYPAVGDVRKATVYGNGNYTGTLVAASVGSPGTINMLAALMAIVRQIPDKVTVAYAERSLNDSYDAGVDFDARRGPMSKGDIDGLSRRWATWHLYALEGQTVQPTRLGKITHGADVWDVIEVDKSYNNLKFDCQCLLRLS